METVGTSLCWENESSHVVLTACQHSVCEPCLIDHIERQKASDRILPPACPFCQQVIADDDLQVLLSPDSMDEPSVGASAADTMPPSAASALPSSSNWTINEPPTEQVHWDNPDRIRAIAKDQVYIYRALQSTEPDMYTSNDFDEPNSCTAMDTTSPIPDPSQIRDRETRLVALQRDANDWIDDVEELSFQEILLGSEESTDEIVGDERNEFERQSEPSLEDWVSLKSPIDDQAVSDNRDSNDDEENADVLDGTDDTQAMPDESNNKSDGEDDDDLALQEALLQSFVDSQNCPPKIITEEEKEDKMKGKKEQKLNGFPAEIIIEDTITREKSVRRVKGDALRHRKPHRPSRRLQTAEVMELFSNRRPIPEKQISSSDSDWAPPPSYWCVES